MSKRKGALSLEEFIAALTPEEAQEWRAVELDLQSEDGNPEATRLRFFELAAAVTERLGVGHPGSLFGAIKARHAKRPPKAQDRPMVELADLLPYPLGVKTRAVLGGSTGEAPASPQHPFEVCALMGLLVRMSALLAMQDYVSTGGKDAEINRLITGAIQKPADGKWLELAQALTSKLKGRDLTWLDRVHETLDRRPSGDPELKTAAGGSKRVKALLADVIGFRNRLVHGEAITDADVARAAAQTLLATRGFQWLADYELQVRSEEQDWLLSGAVPRPSPRTGELSEGTPTLVHRNDAGDRMELSPLLRFRPGDSDTESSVELEDLFFLNAGSRERLSYVGYRAGDHVDGRTLGTYEEFKAFLAKIPAPQVPADPRIDFSALARQHGQLFVGRQELLVELTDRVASGSQAYLLVKALAGMGKTAVMANLLLAELNRREQGGGLRSAADGLLREGDIWVFHFCRPTEGHNSPVVALRSIIAQICDHVGLPRDKWLSSDLDQLKDHLLPSLLSEVSASLDEERRLVIAVDALDEGIGGESESIPSCLPAAPYKGVVFLLSYRVDAACKNSRVERNLQHLDPALCVTAERASPLQGLQRPELREFCAQLQAGLSDDEVSEEAEDAAWAAASRDAVDGLSEGADPFYLRFLANGVQQGRIRLDRTETIPSSLDSAFEDLWMSLPTDKDFLCQRLLLTLAVLREYGEDALMSELLQPHVPDADPLSPDDIARARRAAGKMLVYDEDRYGLFHDRFRRFLVGEVPDPVRDALENA